MELFIIDNEFRSLYNIDVFVDSEKGAGMGRISRGEDIR